jgi:hypothetical protein
MNLCSNLKPTPQNREKTPTPRKAAMKYVISMFPTVNDNILGSFMQRNGELTLSKLYKKLYLACDSYIHLPGPQTRLFRFICQANRIKTFFFNSNKQYRGKELCFEFYV